MTSVFDVAKYILEQKGPMSTWKLQKLCYYSQAWSLAWGDGALFPEEFQAWSNGPVCRPLFLQHQGRYRIGAGDLSVGDSSVLSDLQKEDIGRIDVKERYAYVAISRKKLNQTLQLTKGEKIKGIRTIVESVR